MSSERKTDVAAIVLAAGRGTRFGEQPKLLQSLGGLPLVQYAVDAALGSGARPVIVVLGHGAAEVAAALADRPVMVVHNERYRGGLSTSLQAGFGALPASAEAAIVLLGDMPLVRASHVDALISRWFETGRAAAAIVSVLHGRRGNPVLLACRLAPEIASLAGDVGAAALLRGRNGVLELDLADSAVAEDVDTPDALRRLEALDQARTKTTLPRIAE